MSAVEVVTIAQANHFPWPNGGLLDCSCGIQCFTLSEWCAHVAAEVVRALGLAEEWTWSWPNGSAQGVPGFGFSVATRAEAEEEGGEYTIVSRHVTPWSAEGTP